MTESHLCCSIQDYWRREPDSTLGECSLSLLLKEQDFEFVKVAASAKHQHVVFVAAKWFVVIIVEVRNDLRIIAPNFATNQIVADSNCCEPSHTCLFASLTPKLSSGLP